MGSIDIPKFLQDKMKKNIEANKKDSDIIDVPDFLKKKGEDGDLLNGVKKSGLEIPSILNDPPKKAKSTGLVTEDFNAPIYQIKKEDNKNNVVTSSEILGSLKILDEDIPSSILDKSGYRKSLQQRLSLKQPSELDLQVIAAKTKKPIDVVKEYAIGKDGKGIMLEFDGIKAKKSTQLNQLLQSANKDLGLNDSFDAVFNTAETAKAYLDKIQQAYDTKTEQDFNLVNTVEVDGKKVQYTGEFYPERMLEKNFGEGQRIYNLMKAENSGKVNALKEIIGDDIIEKTAKEEGLTYDQRAEKIGKLVYGKDLKQIKEAYNKRQSIEALGKIDPIFKLGGIFSDEKEEKKNLNAINSIAEVKLNNAIKEQLIYDQAVLNDTLQEAIGKSEAGTLSDTDRAAYQDKVEQLKKGIEEKQAEYKTPKQLQDKYPVILKQSLIADINEFNAIKSGNVKQYEDGGYENTNLVQHLVGKGYDMKSQVVKDVIVDAVTSGKEIKDYSFFGSPIKAMTETFTSALKSLGDITGLRDDVTILSEKKAGELFPTTVSDSDELQLSGAAKVGQNIGNTTGQVLGQGLLQAGTAGLGRLAGLSKVAAANSGFWSSGALTSYDAAYKDAYDFIDSNAGRTAYAGLIALLNAASEKIFPEAKLFNIPGVKSAVAELASKVGTKEMTEKLANQLLTKAKNAFIDYGKKYASNVGKDTLEETATSLFESGARFVFGDPNISYDKAIENAKNTAIQTAIGTSLIGGMGVHKDVQQEKNIAPSSVIYNAAVYKDEAIDALNIGHDQGLYDQQELNKKISLLNTAEVGLSELKKAEDVFGRELSRPQKELFVANYTAQKLLNEQKKEVDEPVIVAKIDERLKNLQNQQTQLLENKAQFDDFGNVVENTKLSQPIEGVDEQGIPVGNNVPAPVKIEKDELTIEEQAAVDIITATDFNTEDGKRVKSYTDIIANPETSIADKKTALRELGEQLADKRSETETGIGLGKAADAVYAVNDANGVVVNEGLDLPPAINSKGEPENIAKPIEINPEIKVAEPTKEPGANTEQKIKDLELERDAEVIELSKPDIRLEPLFVQERDLANSKDPIQDKKAHNSIKDRYKELKKLINCLHAK